MAEQEMSAKEGAATGGASAVPALPPDALIIVPVRNTVLFPGLVLPITLGRPKSIAVSVEEPCPITGEEPGSGWGVGRESEAVVVPIEPRDNTTRGEGRAAASFTRTLGALDW